MRGRPARLIVFTRIPEPGTAKTRLIPALGARGAADLQKRMTGYTLHRVRLLARQTSVSVEVRYDGRGVGRVRQWLGEDLLYAAQGQGDLGRRMERAFRDGFRAGAKRVVVMGTDCPGLSPEYLRQAFEALERTEVVIGPARDGGYVLLGLRKPVAALFHDVPWGSDRVLARTLERVKDRGLTVCLLEPLRDVDRPEDLPVWEAETRGSPLYGKGFSLSVVIPALEEVGQVIGALESTREALDVVDRIVVDGGSLDGTADRARDWGARVLSCPKGRAIQTNAGARAARGSVLLFLHADTRLPFGFEDHVRSVLSLPHTVAGAFRHAIQGAGTWLRLIEHLANFRAVRLGMPYGDQGLFLSADRFRKAGLFPEIPIMEDFELVRRLRRQGRVRIAPSAAVSSSRRYRRRGVLGTTLVNQAMIAGYLAGIPPERLARWYRRSS